MTSAGAQRSEPRGHLRAPNPAPTPDRGAVPASWPRHLRVVGPKRASGAWRPRLVLAAASSAAVVVLFGLVYLHVLSAQRQFTLDRLSVQAQTAAQTYQRLRLEVDQLDTPAHIMAAAAKLGMSQPSSVHYLTGRVSVTTPPPGARAGAPAPTGISDWPAVESELVGLP